ncbi:hypothetical protein N9Z68_02835 [Akkermansiaceae bacterium]|nr:hypothetical protein [Akkermansiaceae bacterium]MDB4521649.1 hypothetical protein [Akkermansiaceae bacterium]
MKVSLLPSSVTLEVKSKTERADHDSSRILSAFFLIERDTLAQLRGKQTTQSLHDARLL